MTFLLHHMLHASASRSPSKEALVHGSERLTYEALAERVSALAAGLRYAGVRRGDRIGIYLEPSIAQVLSIFAVTQAGGVFVPINAALLPTQVQHLANDCRLMALVTTVPKLITISSILKDVPSLEFAVTPSDKELLDSHVPVHSLDDLSRASSALPPDTCIEKDLAAILYTSGSTGKPKGVMLSHSHILAGTSIVSTYLEINDAERILAVLPFSFDAGLNQLMTAVQQRGTCVLLKFIFARDVVTTLLTERITGLAGVPTFWSLLTQPSSTLDRHEFPHLRYITNTGGAMPQTVLALLRKRLPTTRIFLMYGLTEAFRSTYLPPEELDRRPTSIGKAIPNTEIMVVHEEGRLCRPGETGELVHRGPTVSMGYWGRPDLTAEVLRPHPFLASELGDTERVAYSGDLVTLDEEGFLYFVGRRDNMIKSSGFRISPTEVEEALMETGVLREVAVIGLPDAVLGQSIKALVVLREDAVVDGETLRAGCAARLPAYMIPKHIEILASLPKTPSGKVDYQALRERAVP